MEARRAPPTEHPPGFSDCDFRTALPPGFRATHPLQYLSARIKRKEFAANVAGARNEPERFDKLPRGASYVISWTSCRTLGRTDQVVAAEGSYRTWSGALESGSSFERVSPPPKTARAARSSNLLAAKRRSLPRPRLPARYREAHKFANSRPSAPPISRQRVTAAGLKDVHRDGAAFRSRKTAKAAASPPKRTHRR